MTIYGFSPEPIVVQTAAATALEIVESIGRQLPQLRADPILGPKQIEVVGHRSVEALSMPLQADEIEIVPAFVGAKSGLGQILLGGLLVALSFVPGLQFFSGFLLKMGAMMILGGLAQLLNPTPKQDKGDREESRYLGAPLQTTKIGTRIPILYGRRKWGGHLLSHQVDAMQVKYYD